MSNQKKKKAVKATPVKPQKPRKNKKKMSPETKDKIKTSFLTLINNDACVKVSREYHGFGWAALAVTIAVASVILADVPSLVTRLQVNYGDSVLNAPNFSLDQQLANFAKELEEKGVVLEIKDGKPVVDHWENVQYTVEGKEPKTWYADYSSSLDKVVFEAFVNSEKVGGMTVEDSVFFSRITSGKDPYTDQTREGYGASDAKYATNFIAFGQEHIMIGRYNANGQGSTLAGINADLEGVSIPGFAKEIKDGNSGQYPDEQSFVSQMTAKWKNVIVRSTDRQKMQSSWSYAGILFGVYAGIEFIFGLVIFLLTRGKRNPYRIYTFWETQKMSYWAGLCPALLSLAFGFAFTQFALMLFIFLFGMRLMWLSMKTMRPMN